MCHECLSKIQIHGFIILCPFDRQPTDIGDSGIWGLKKNFALLELLERLELNKNIQQTQSTDSEESEGIQCDEDNSHTATLYCTVCLTSLCNECASLTHISKTLSKHKHVPISEKPRINPPCPIHPNHLLEFVCMEDSCIEQVCKIRLFSAFAALLTLLK